MDMQGSLQKIPVRDIVVGMYVARLDRSWAGTPFSVQGFHVRNRDDIQVLRTHCQHVYIDTRRSKIVAKSPGEDDAAASVLPISRGAYDADRLPFSAEIARARRHYRAISLLLIDGDEQLQQQQDIPYLSLRRAAVNVVDGICRNPDAYAWAARVYDHETWHYRSAVRAGIWAVTAGREMGLQRDRLLMLLLGCVLADIGSTMPRDTASSSLDAGVDLLRKTVGIDDEVLTVVAAHHERHDGSGHPRGLKKDRIPLLARLSAVAEHYEVITSPRPEREVPLSAIEAMSELNALRGTMFMGSVIDEFIRALGVYPVGSLVELSNGDVAIVQQQHEDRRLKPIVQRVVRPGGRRYHWRRMLDLRAAERNGGPRAVRIVKSLPHGAFGVDPRALVRKPIFGF